MEDKEYDFVNYWFGNDLVDMPIALTMLLLDLDIHVDWVDLTQYEDDFQTFVGIPYKKVYLNPLTLDQY